MTMHRMVENLIESQGWAGLRPMQQRVFDPIARAEQDVLVVAGTASGKTEAAFLPIFSSILSEPRDGSTRCLCISPMKALINDQFDRLQRMGEYLGISVARWHGDVSASTKRKARENPPEVLIITPESLEAQLFRRGYELRTRFGELRWVVIDEFHLFLGRQRGSQIESQLTRLDTLIGTRAVRVALSATVGDTAEAERFLAGGSERATLVAVDDGPPTKFRYEFVMPDLVDDGEGGKEQSSQTLDAIADEIVARFTGGAYLAFANSKASVEELTDAVRLSAAGSRPECVALAHHGSLSAEERHRTERLLASVDEPTIVVATSTLEVGIDIPAIETIGQLGAPTSVATLRQRLGRSGRRNSVPSLHMYLQRPTPITSAVPALDRLRPEVLQAIAVVELAVEGWAEPSSPAVGRWSTLVHQVLSTVSERGGCAASELHAVLLTRGQFASLPTASFAALLQQLGGSGHLVQNPGSPNLHLGPAGERLVMSADFCAVFETSTEYLIYCGTKELGAVIRSPWQRAGDPLTFAGRRWMIHEIDDRRRIIVVVADDRKKVPVWHGSPQPVHREIRRRMVRIYENGSTLDVGTASDALEEARVWYERLQVRDTPYLDGDRSALLFTFDGTIETSTLVALLRMDGLDAQDAGSAIRFEKGRAAADFSARVETALRSIISSEAQAVDVVPHLGRLHRPKFHDLLPPDLQTDELARDLVRIPGAVAVARRLIGTIDRVADQAAYPGRRQRDA